MVRPTKSVTTRTGAMTKDEKQKRLEQERKLKGKGNNILAPEHLNDRQKKIFNHIVDELRVSGILGNLDVYILETCVFALERKQQLQIQINNDPDKEDELITKLDRYAKIFFRCCNELSLSPQARAKIGNINTQQKQQEQDPLLQVLSGGKV